MQAMKVSVIGALAAQQQQLTQRSYPNLKLQFANKGHRHKNDDSLITNADRVIIMQKHVGHGIMQKLDRKRAIFAHTLQQAKDALINLNDSVFAEDSVSALAALKQAEQNPKPQVEAVIAVHETAEEHTVAADDMKFDFMPYFINAKEGDVLIFKRPAKLPLKTWEGRIQQARSYYKRKFGVLTSIPVWKDDGTAETLVEKVDKALQAQGKPAMAETPKETTPKSSVVEGKFPPKIESAPSPESARMVASAMQEVTDNEVAVLDRRFWQEVFLQSMKNSPGSPGSYHAQVATMAFDDLRAKLGG